MNKNFCSSSARDACGHNTLIPSPVRLLRRHPIFVRERQLELEIVQEFGHQDSHLHVRNSTKAKCQLKGSSRCCHGQAQDSRFTNAIPRTDRERLIDVAAIVRELSRCIVEPSLGEELVGSGEVDV